MAFLLRHIARYAVRKIATDPRARAAATRTAHNVAEEARHIAQSDDRARAAGQAVRRALDKLQGDR